MSNIKCTKCGVEKEATIDNFYWRKDTNNWRRQCRECQDEQKKNWELQNIDKMLVWRKEWHDQYNKEYYHQNTEKEKERTRNRPKEKVRQYERKRNSKPERRLRNNISRNISYYLSGSGGKRGLSFLQHVNWTYEELLVHVESNFEPWMTWDNYGPYNRKRWDDGDMSTWTWQLDHIIPQSLFKYTSMDSEEFRKCWALENLRPYSAKQNLLDGNRRY